MPWIITGGFVPWIITGGFGPWIITGGFVPWIITGVRRRTVWYAELPQGSPGWGDIQEALSLAKAPDTLGHGGALEVSS